MPDTLTTRAALRDALRDELVDRVEPLFQEIESGPWEGVKVLTHKDVVESIDAIFGAPLPPPSENGAEVKTPASVLVWAVCPRCQEAGSIRLTITPELRVDALGATLRLVGKSKPTSHTCGQQVLALDETDGQASFELEDIIGVPTADGGGDVDQEPCPYPGCSLAVEHEGDHNAPPADDEPPAPDAEPVRPRRKR